LENCFGKLCWKTALENDVGKRLQEMALEPTSENSIGKMVSENGVGNCVRNSIGK
jgi:hypothetical protein